VTSNLTRDDAAARSALITVASYHVDLDLTGGDEVFGSVSVIRFDCAAPGSTSFINLTKKNNKKPKNKDTKFINVIYKYEKKNI